METTGNPSRADLVDWIGDGPAHVVTGVNHETLKLHAIHAAGELEVAGVAVEFICPGDMTRYVFSMIDTDHMGVHIGDLTAADGPRERYVISFGTDEDVGRRELNFNFPPYLPSDCERIANGHKATTIVCWLFLNYLHRAMNPDRPQPLPWLRETGGQ